MKNKWASRASWIFSSWLKHNDETSFSIEALSMCWKTEAVENVPQSITNPAPEYLQNPAPDQILHTWSNLMITAIKEV